MARNYSAEYVTKLKVDASEAKQAATDLGKIVNEQDKKIQKLQDTIDNKFKSLDKNTNILAKGLRSIKTLFQGALGAGITLKAFELLKETFMSNQKVADVFATVMETISLVFNQVVDAVVKGNGEFNALGTVLQNVLNIGLAPFKLAFEGISIAILSARKAFLEFTGGSQKEIAELTMSIVEAKANVVDIASGVVDSGKAIAENFGAAIDGIKEINVTAAYETAKANVELQKSAEVAEVIQQGLIEKYDRQAELQRQIRDDESRSIEERIAANEELGRILDEQEAAMLKQVDMQKAAAQAQYDKNQSQENLIALLQAQNEEEAVLAQITGFKSEQLVNENSLIKEQMDLKKEAQEQEAERINDALQKELEKRKQAAEEQKRITQETQEFNKQAIEQGLSGVTALVGENSKFGKGIAIAQAIRDTYAGATKALAQGGIFGTVAAAGIIASGIANVRAITATSDPTPPSYASAPSGGGFTAPTIQAQAPDFNVVGASGMNQLAETIAGAQAKPQRAYVVANDVTTAQGMDRNIVEGASI